MGTRPWTTKEIAVRIAIPIVYYVVASLIDIFVIPGQIEEFADAPVVVASFQLLSKLWPVVFAILTLALWIPLFFSRPIVEPGEGTSVE